MATMARRHYRLIAEAIAKAERRNDTGDIWTYRNEFIKVLTQDNPDFDEGKFCDEINKLIDYLADDSKIGAA